MRIHFVVDGVPVAQPRPRVATRDQRGNVLRKPHAYEATSRHPIHAWKRTVEVAALPHRPREVIASPFAMAVDFYFPGGNSGERHGNKPDLDNLVKPIADVMTELGYWCDDSLIYELRTTKHYTDAGTGAEVTLAWEFPVEM